MSDASDASGASGDASEIVASLTRITSDGCLSRIWYDKDDGRGPSLRIVEPKLLLDGTSELMMFAYQVRPTRGVRHFVVTRIVRVEPDDHPLLSQDHAFGAEDVLVIKRSGGVPIPSSGRAGSAYEGYLDGVREAVSDLHLEDWEIERIRDLRQRGELTMEQIRAAHAAIYAEYLLAYARDGRLDGVEAEHLALLADGLETLGWRPA